MIEDANAARQAEPPYTLHVQTPVGTFDSPYTYKEDAVRFAKLMKTTDGPNGPMVITLTGPEGVIDWRNEP